MIIMGQNKHTFQKRRPPSKLRP
uniref:Uncharacterized protein n=1 Tax=Arundo donax TaxID=35708 RepID=A0A0A9ALX7_ARUDO